MTNAKPMFHFLYFKKCLQPPNASFLKNTLVENCACWVALHFYEESLSPKSRTFFLVPTHRLLTLLSVRSARFQNVWRFNANTSLPFAQPNRFFSHKQPFWTTPKELVHKLRHAYAVPFRPEFRSLCELAVHPCVYTRRSSHCATTSSTRTAPTSRFSCRAYSTCSSRSRSSGGRHTRALITSRRRRRRRRQRQRPRQSRRRSGSPWSSSRAWAASQMRCPRRRRRSRRRSCCVCAHVRACSKSDTRADAGLIR